MLMTWDEFSVLITSAHEQAIEALKELKRHIPVVYIMPADGPIEMVIVPSLSDRPTIMLGALFQERQAVGYILVNEVWLLEMPFDSSKSKADIEKAVRSRKYEPSTSPDRKEAIVTVGVHPAGKRMIVTLFKKDENETIVIDKTVIQNGENVRGNLANLLRQRG